MVITQEIRDVLNEVGQVAAEVGCPNEGYREFVSVYLAQTDKLLNFKNNFPYFENLEKVYRVIRFRVDAQLIEEDANIGPDDLFGHQEIYLPDEEAVCFIMNIWQVPIEDLSSPRFVDIPV